VTFAEAKQPPPQRKLRPQGPLPHPYAHLTPQICDFGLARVLDTNIIDPDFLTEYVATRWYRAPEILLSWSGYGPASHPPPPSACLTLGVDMWSVGCIFAEMMGRKPLVPGKSCALPPLYHFDPPLSLSADKHQVELILDMLGRPKEETLECVQSSRVRVLILKI
jgi:serine/threonine protein kinase